MPDAAAPQGGAADDGDKRGRESEEGGAGLTVGGMAAVPGGPVRLPPVVRAYQSDMQGLAAACVAPFRVDVGEVTNAEYLAFWHSLPAAVRQSREAWGALYPAGWAEGDVPFPPKLARVPVLGVRLAGARAYAAWAGKRLPTPYEWCLAAFGPTGGTEAPKWASEYLHDRRRAWQEIVAAHQEYARANPYLLPGPDHDETRPSVGEFWRLPWVFWEVKHLQASIWSKACVERLAGPLFARWVDPIYVLPSGSRKYDVSPCGARDMILNAQEMVAPIPYEDAERYMQVQWLNRHAHAHGGYRFAVATATSPTLTGLTQRESTFVENDFIVGGIHRPGGTVYSGFGYDEFDTTLQGYTARMLSRRVRSASQNVRPGQVRFVLADLMDYVLMAAAIHEYSEMLRPITDVRLDMVNGVTYDLPFSTRRGTELKVRYIDPNLSLWQPRGGASRWVRNGPPTLAVKEQFMDASLLAYTPAFRLWGTGPRHFHREMGRPVATDPYFPFNSRPFSYNSAGMPTAPDTYLTPSGFRCVR